MSKLEKILLLINLFLFAILAIFSYAYVDLNLTLSQNPVVLDFVKNMQQLGYFNRPIATLLYLLIIVFTFSFFILNLWLFYKSKVGLKYLKITTMTNVVILVLAYPFLSSDLFNYLFDAKIIVNYHVSPYNHKPLDFPNDDWLRFMRWTHRYSPYGPLWLAMSLIPASLGFGKFILNFFAFKIFIGTFHLINTYLIFRILNSLRSPNVLKRHLRGGQLDSSEVDSKMVLMGTAFYALNPLFLIEGVANAHNDVVLATFLLLPIYLLTTGKTLGAYFAITAGILIKYIPILNLPWLVLTTVNDNQKDSRLKLIILNLITMAIFTYLYSSFRITVPFVSSGATQVQFQPWYLFWTLPLLALLPKDFLIIPSIILCLSASLRYLPYLYNGDWSHPGTIAFMQYVTIIPPLLVSLIFIPRYFRK